MTLKGWRVVKPQHNQSIKGQGHGLKNFFNIFFAKCLHAGEDGPWAGASVSYWHISSLLREVKQFWQELPAKNVY